MRKSHLVAPSVLAANWADLTTEMKMINGSEADWLHVDVMDGMFVPNISFGQHMVKTLKSICDKPLDVHLMIERPERYVEEFVAAGADVVTFHLEATNHAHRVIGQIKAAGAKAGIAVNPHTNVSLLEDLIEDLDLVCLMSVNPGFGGQKFIYQTLLKTKKLRKMIDEKNSKAVIEIDGGVGLQNAEQILKAGADVLVAGSSVFKAADPTKAISMLKSIVLNPLVN